MINAFFSRVINSSTNRFFTYLWPGGKRISSVMGIQQYIFSLATSRTSSEGVFFDAVT